MTGAGWVSLGVAAIVAVLAAAPASAASRGRDKEMRSAAGVSAQARRAPTRIEVHPLWRAEREPLHRECVPVFTERMIPQWGGLVLYASQRCWWAGG